MNKKVFIFTAVLLCTGVLFLVGCASMYMVETTQLENGNDYAIVNFIRPSSFGGAIKFGVWDRDTLIGVLTPTTCIQYKATPGVHLFLVRAENWGIVKAKVVAGKTYTLLAEPRMGLLKANVHMTVIKPGDKRLAKWMKDATYVTVDAEKRDAYIKKHIADVKKALIHIDSGSAEIQAAMMPNDGT